MPNNMAMYMDFLSAFVRLPSAQQHNVYNLYAGRRVVFFEVILFRETVRGRSHKLRLNHRTCMVICPHTLDAGRVEAGVGSPIATVQP